MMQSSLENLTKTALIHEENTSLRLIDTAFADDSPDSELLTPDFQLIWSQVLTQLSKKLKKPSFETWIRPTNLIKIQNDEAVIAVRNEFSRNFILQSYQKEIQEAIKEVLATSLRIRIIIDSDISFPHIQEESLQTSIAVLETNTKKQELQVRTKNKLNSQMIFENYVVASFNQTSATFTKALVENTLGFYQSLYVFSEPGLGKTHLLHAIGNEALKTNPNLRLKYMRAEEFTNEFIIAIQRNQTQEFKNQYRNLDLLLVDDLEFLEGKKTCGEEFYYTYNALISRGARIVLSSSKNINELKLNANLKGLLKSALISEIHRPDFSARVKILINKASQADIKLTASHLDVIAHKYSENIRELESALLQLSAYKNYSEHDIDDELVAKLFGGVGSDVRYRGLSIEHICKAVSEYYGQDYKDVRGKRRNQEFTQARHLAIYLAYSLLEISYGRIGEYFSGRKHSSIIHSVKTIDILVNSELARGKQLQAAIQQIKAGLTN